MFWKLWCYDFGVLKNFGVFALVMFGESREKKHTRLCWVEREEAYETLVMFGDFETVRLWLYRNNHTVHNTITKEKDTKYYTRDNHTVLQDTRDTIQQHSLTLWHCREEAHSVNGPPCFAPPDALNCLQTVLPVLLQRMHSFFNEPFSHGAQDTNKQKQNKNENS